ncbi:MAG: hypothetical protein DWQ04_15245 [Chloroflexi bacterium]|nr:MAG: hypothetical protein DWQ04_15245 [Chloroflexota bacterium]
MTKFFNNWTRKCHRWIALPTLILIPLAVIAKFAGDSVWHLPPQAEQFQSILMLLLAISGAYMYLLPTISKWQRNQRKKAKAAAAAAAGVEK